MTRRRLADGDRESHPGEPDDSRFTSVPEARKKAMDYLARREYGRLELAAKLAGAGFDAQTAAEAIAGLVRDGLQDDARFVEGFITARANQGKGPVRIRLELGQRGIDAALVEEALATVGHDWAAIAHSVRQRKFGPDRPLDFRDKARQMRFLQYRGFDQEQINMAMELATAPRNS